jgi:hypothetical protein
LVGQPEEAIRKLFADVRATLAENPDKVMFLVIDEGEELFRRKTTIHDNQNYRSLIVNCFLDEIGEDVNKNIVLIITTNRIG